MRGGTSKALFFHEHDLPADEALRDRIILSALGSPDVRQIDGMGGANTTTSKVAIIKKSAREGVDVDYTFRQVSPESAIVGKTMNCGNISSAVGPFAIDEGLVEAVEPVTVVRIYNTNTDKIMVSHVPVRDGRAMTEGDFELDGVPGTGAKIQIEFSNPQGAISGKLLPTGNPCDTIAIDGKTYEYSLLDVGNPTVFVRAEQFGLTGLELPGEFEALPNSGEICRLLEVIRGTCAIALGLASDLEDAAVNSQTLPKITLCTTPKNYTAGNGRCIEKESVQAGPYARYAQRYLGVMPPLADRTASRIVSARIDYADPQHTLVSMVAQQPAGEKVMSYVFGGTGSARSNPDRISATDKSTEEMARDAAGTIFALRRQRLEILTGEAGEFYAGGLDAVLNDITRMEDEYLALFLGRQSVVTTTHEIEVVPQADRMSYIVCRFSEQDGLLPDSDLSGQPVVLSFVPEKIAAPIPAPKAGKQQLIRWRVADFAECRLAYEQQELAKRRIPVYQFGVTVTAPAQ